MRQKHERRARTRVYDTPGRTARARRRRRSSSPHFSAIAVKLVLTQRDGTGGPIRGSNLVAFWPPGPSIQGLTYSEWVISCDTATEKTGPGVFGTRGGSNGVTGECQAATGKDLKMKTMGKLIASLVAITALALMAATTVAAGSPHATYTCVKVKENGKSDVRVDVPEPAVAGLTNAGFTCVANAAGGEGEDPGNEDPGDEDPGDAGSGPAIGSSVEVHVPQEPRSIYCSTNGPAFRANGDGMGVALNLLDEQGALLVERELVTPAIFYQGVGASCDVLPGFEYSGAWVDHVGDVVPGVAVYPLFVPASTG
jgi:hypothetical protein